MKVLFAIGQDTSNSIQENILKQFQMKYNKSFEYKSEYYVEGAMKCLEEAEGQYDVLILNETLENVAVDTKLIDTITDLYPNLQVILAIDDKHKEDDYTSKLYTLGVYDALYFSDFTDENLLELLDSRRSKKQAKDYYCIEEKIDDIDIKFQITPITEDELNKTISVLHQSIKDGNLSEIFKEVDKEYNPKEMCYLLTMLPQSILDELKKANDKVYRKYEKIVEKEIKGIDASPEVKTEIKYVEKIKEVPIIKKVEVEKEKPIVVEKEILKVSQVRYDSIIAVIGNAPAGKSYVTWNLSHALSEHYKVAVICIDNSSSASAYFGIDDNENAPLHDIENKSIKQIAEEGVYINKNLVVYTNKFGERAELRRNTLSQLISAIRSQDINIIIIDLATGYSTSLLSAISVANDVLAVYSMDNAHIRMNDLLLSRLDEELYKNNTIAVLNNVYRNSKEYKNVLNYLNKSEKFKEIVPISNCGDTTYDYMYSKSCNYKKDNNEFTRDIDVLINTLKLQSKQSNKNKKKDTIFSKFIRRPR